MYTAANTQLSGALNAYMNGDSVLWKDGNFFAFYNLGLLFLFKKYNNSFYKLGKVSVNNFNKKYAGSFENWRDWLKEKDIKKKVRLDKKSNELLGDAIFLKNVWLLDLDIFNLK